MAAWLVTNFIWIAIAIVVIIVGLKLVIGGVLKRLMDQSAAEAARRGENADPPDSPRG